MFSKAKTKKKVSKDYEVKEIEKFILDPQLKLNSNFLEFINLIRNNFPLDQNIFSLLQNYPNHTAGEVAMYIEGRKEIVNYINNLIE